MFDLLHNLFYTELSVNHYKIVFIVFSAVSLITHLVAILLSVFVVSFTFKKRIYQLIVVIAIYLISNCACGLRVEFKIYCEFLFAVNLLLCLPLFFIRVKKSSENDELNGLIDRAILGSDDVLKQPTKLERLRCKTIQMEKIEQNEDINFSHIKGILERLNFYPLSTADKNKMRELEGLIIQVESGECLSEYKNKINDGLGELLKIMSRYGV